MKNNDYTKKYLDPRWQKKRLKILERDNWECQKCSDKNNTLHVHHRYYSPCTDPWDYPDEALVALCEHCHQIETEHTAEALNSLCRAIKKHFFSNEIFGLAHSINEMKLLDKSEYVADGYIMAFDFPDIQKTLMNEYQQEIECRPDGHKIYQQRKFL